MKTKHTPKEWHLIGDTITGITPYKDKNGNEIGDPGQTIDIEIARLSGYYPPEMNNANGILMASSPDLLESLQEFVAYFKDYEMVLNDQFRAMLGRAEAAIKKATD